MYSSIHTLKETSDLLRIAEDELQRPNEDAVTLSACHCVRDSASNSLRGYLQSKSIKITETSTLSDLQYQCAKLDAQFKNIDLSCFDCRHESLGEKDSYCLSVDKVKKCYDNANMIHGLVMQKLKLTEKDLK